MLKHRTRKKLGEGKYYPLGAAVFPNGVNFAIYSKNAKEVFLLLFDGKKEEPTDIIELESRTKFVWHVFVYGLKPGQLYGYKVKGDYDPANGLRFNENKLLIDPYSKAVSEKIVNKNGLLFSYNPRSLDGDLSFDPRDSSRVMPKSIVISDKFDWRTDKSPGIPFENAIIYEVHLKGFTAHRSSNVKNPGTYLGFIEKIPYLKELGITTVEFLPIQEFYGEDFLAEKGLKDYWGYDTVGFFAPDSSYSTGEYPGCQVKEFKTLVRALHKAGMEVIMDVCYNHTGEGNEMGPAICLKGIDNPTYYMLNGPQSEPARYYANYTGCGNTINACDPIVIKVILDSLRYWVEQMHVDGFRFDLASTLGREEGKFSCGSSFFDVISQDPVLSKIKLIAEPWDLESSFVGMFPIDWSEWNGRFRDSVRKFTKGYGGELKEVSKRLEGSPDLYCDDGRTVYNSINFITCHDGFTLNDLVSYDYKRNEANLEDNRDGSDANYSWNCGVEGDTDDENILRLRKQLAKNFICYLFLASGTPMLQGGDEFLRTQKGNNNAYCQDNNLSWFNWGLAKKNKDFLRFCKNVIRMVKEYKVLQMRRYSFGHLASKIAYFEFKWFGKNLNKPDWNNPSEKTLSFYAYVKEKKGREYGIFAIYNCDQWNQRVRLPDLPNNKRWFRKIDTSLKSPMDFMERPKRIWIDPPDHYLANARSVVLLIGD